MTQKENKNAVLSQLMAVSVTRKYRAAVPDTGEKVSHYPLDKSGRLAMCALYSAGRRSFQRMGVANKITYIPSDHDVQEHQLDQPEPSSFVDAILDVVDRIAAGRGRGSGGRGRFSERDLFRVPLI